MGKNIKSFNEFINESQSLNEKKFEFPHEIVIRKAFHYMDGKLMKGSYFDQRQEAAGGRVYLNLDYNHQIVLGQDDIEYFAKHLPKEINMNESLEEGFQGWDRNRVYGMFNDHNGKPTKLSKEILDICMKGLPKKVTDNISDVTGAGWKETMISPTTVSNKGQSRGEIEYTTIVLNFIEPMGKDITHMTVGLRKRTSGPGTGYLAIELSAGGHTVDDGEHAIEFMDNPEKFLGKLYQEKFESLLK